MSEIIQALTLLVLGLSASYFFGMVGLGVLASRSRGAGLGAQACIRYEQPEGWRPVYGSDPTACARYSLYYLVPCLNEARVIGSTVSILGTVGTVIVVDDASDDETSAIARAAARTELHAIRRELPDARRGKGPALNAGFAKVLDLVRERGEHPDDVIVCVMDADGRLSFGALTVALPLFDDAKVGGVQLTVRIRNRHSFLTRFQNFQFWAMSAMTQYGRIRTGTVSLGGNGQFTRLSALLSIGDAPWNASLTEDLDLTISMLVGGWRCTTTPHASVDQQGVERLGPLLRQRTRWYQGHMMAGARIPDIWRSPRIRHTSAVEAILYLLVPWVLDLPWSVLYHLALVTFFVQAEQEGIFHQSSSSHVIGWIALYLAAFYPAIITSVLCFRRDPQVGALHAVLLGHSFVLMNYLSWTCSWRALARMVRRQNGWTKTARSTELEPPPSALSLAGSAA